MKKAHYTWIKLFAAMTVVLGLMGCSKESNGDDSPEADSSAIQVANNVISDGAITIDFGTNQIANGKARVSVVTSTPNETSNSLVSSLYQLTIDTRCSKPVKVSLPVPDSFNEENYLLLGVGMDYTLNSGETDRVFTHYKTTIANGKATVEFTPSDITEAPPYLGVESGGTKAASNLKIYLGYFEDGCYYAEEGHFNFWYPGGYVINNAKKAEMLDLLESIYTYYSNKNYKVGTERLDVYLKRGIKDDGYYHTLHNTVTLNTRLMEAGNENLRKTVMYHEYFHYIQDNYDDSFYGNIWFDEATASYFEALIGKSTYTGLTSENLELLYASIIPASSTPKDGYARPPLIAYISTLAAGDDWIRQLYEKGANNTNIRKYLLDLTGFTSSNFYDALARGEVGGNMPYTFHKNLTSSTGGEYSYGTDIGSAMKLNLPSTSQISAATENGKTFTIGTASFTMKGSGCRIVAIDAASADLSNLPNTATLDYTANDDISITCIKSRAMACENVPFPISVKEFKADIANSYRYTIVITAVGVESQTKSASLKLNIVVPPAPVYNTVQADPDYASMGIISGSFLSVIRVGLYQAGPVKIGADGSFQMYVPSTAGSIYTITDLTVTGKINYSTMMLTCTISYNCATIDGEEIKKSYFAGTAEQYQLSKDNGHVTTYIKGFNDGVPSEQGSLKLYFSYVNE